jgi:hypothetical protein
MTRSRQNTREPVRSSPPPPQSRDEWSTRSCRPFPARSRCEARASCSACSRALMTRAAPASSQLPLSGDSRRESSSRSRLRRTNWSRWQRRCLCGNRVVRRILTRHSCRWWPRRSRGTGRCRTAHSRGVHSRVRQTRQHKNSHNLLFTQA